MGEGGPPDFSGKIRWWMRFCTQPQSTVILHYEFCIFIHRSCFAFRIRTRHTAPVSSIRITESAAAMGAIGEAEKLASIQSVMAGVSEGQKMILLLCMTILPCVLMLVSNFLYQKKYKLDEDEYARICAELGK